MELTHRHTNEGTEKSCFYRERGTPTNIPNALNMVIWYKGGGTGACQKMVQKAGKRQRSVLKRTEKKEHKKGKGLGFAKA